MKAEGGPDFPGLRSDHVLQEPPAGLGSGCHGDLGHRWHLTQNPAYRMHSLDLLNICSINEYLSVPEITK